VQIDIVGYRRDDVVDIGECKWGKVSSMERLLKELKTKIASYPNKDNKTINGRLFLRSRRKLPNDSNIQVNSLDDLYSLT